MEWGVPCDAGRRERKAQPGVLPFRDAPPRIGSRSPFIPRVLMQRREGLAKLTGRERYVDDLPLENFLWGMTVRSPAPRGRIAAVRFAEEVDWSQFVIVDHRDIPGPNVVALIEQDQPVLAGGYVRHVHEPDRKSTRLNSSHTATSRMPS